MVTTWNHLSYNWRTIKVNEGKKNSIFFHSMWIRLLIAGASEMEAKYVLFFHAHLITRQGPHAYVYCTFICCRGTLTILRHPQRSYTFMLWLILTGFLCNGPVQGMTMGGLRNGGKAQFTAINDLRVHTNVQEELWAVQHMYPEKEYRTSLLQSSVTNVLIRKILIFRLIFILL